MSENQVEKGTVVVMTSGSYSDYRIKDYLLVTQSFDPEAVVERFKASGKYLEVSLYSGRGIPDGSHDRFMAWLIEEGLVETVEPDAVREWHLGEYEDLEPII